MVLFGTKGCLTPEGTTLFTIWVNADWCPYRTNRNRTSVTGTGSENNFCFLTSSGLNFFINNWSVSNVRKDASTSYKPWRGNKPWDLQKRRTPLRGVILDQTYSRSDGHSRRLGDVDTVRKWFSGRHSPDLKFGGWEEESVRVWRLGPHRLFLPVKTSRLPLLLGGTGVCTRVSLFIIVSQTQCLVLDLKRNNEGNFDKFS